MPTRRELVLDRFQEGIVIRHVFDDVVADHRVEMRGRQLSGALVVGAGEDLVQHQSSAGGRFRIGLDAPALVGSLQLLREPTTAAADLQRASELLRQERQHFLADMLKIWAGIHGDGGVWDARSLRY